MDLDLGHGFVPRIDRANYRALERALGPRSLVDATEIELPWVILDGTWAPSAPELLQRLRSQKVRHVIDTAGWRFQDASAFSVSKLTALPHAPAAPWSQLTVNDYQRFVADDLRFQASLGAGAYLVPGLIPSHKDADLTAYDRAARSAVENICFDAPLPAIATVGVHTQGLDIARHRLDMLSGVYSAIYLQATPIKPYRDSVGKLRAW